MINYVFMMESDDSDSNTSLTIKILAFLLKGHTSAYRVCDHDQYSSYDLPYFHSNCTSKY